MTKQWSRMRYPIIIHILGLSLSVALIGCGEGLEGENDDATSSASATAGNPMPFGWEDGIDGAGVVGGWACDANDYSKPLAIHFYEGSRFVGNTVASTTRESAVAQLCGGYANHGFRYQLPASVLDGQPHQITAYAINIPLDGMNPPLSGSPKVVQVSSTQPPPTTGRPKVICDALRGLNGSAADASATIQGCINQTPSGGVLRLPAGRYNLSNRVVVSRAIKIATENKLEADPTCAVTGASGCAELVADANFYHSGGFFDLSAEGAFADHLIFDGNRAARMNSAAASSCAGGANGYGYNMRVTCSHCKVSKSVSKNALCGTALEVSGRGVGVTLVDNTIAYNGIHNRSGLWADGITLHDYSDSTITGNQIINSTDIDLILGGCARCVVQRNRIVHDGSSTGSYAALMIQRWPGGTSGNFAGADFSSNTIDCGPNKACGFGILIGSNPWYAAPISGGAVHDNVIQNPQQGLAIQDASSVAVYRNTVSGRKTTTRVSCHPSSPMSTSNLSRSPAASNINYGGESAASYNAIDWIACIPNWAI
ncbi:MAG: right-handed parallel beta-helix repeat-containing protein [Deltaproteobacteria bacterium]|nr:right-handed parallel beta-helix repeat-containing protein [Deltaproteobacteria bacterium]